LSAEKEKLNERPLKWSKRGKRGLDAGGVVLNEVGARYLWGVTVQGKDGEKQRKNEKDRGG